MATWTVDDFCRSQSPSNWTELHVPSQGFLKSLDLSSVHPFCGENAPNPYDLPGVPPQGPLRNRDHLETTWDVLVTAVAMGVPSLLAMGELWIRLFASVIAPAGIAHLLWKEIDTRPVQERRIHGSELTYLSMVCLLSVASSVVLLTDTLYVLEYGPRYGAVLLAVSTVLSFRACVRHGLGTTAIGNVCLLLLAIVLIYDRKTGTLTFGHPDDHVAIEEGTYYDDSNTFIKTVVEHHWPARYRTYSIENGATPWMPTGDSRTGIPFLLNRSKRASWNRLWLPVADGEVVALDIAFPAETGHDDSNPVYLLLHGLNGGSQEEFVNDFAVRRNSEGSTVVVMIARGLMDLPVRGMNTFHGARTSDAHEAALAVRAALIEGQVLAGVGYSMGAIVLSNYVATAGADCALDAAVAVSGGLDMRYETHFYRARRLWQPIVAQELRDTFVVGKFGERVRSRLSKEDMKRLMRATHITGVDETAVVIYNGFRDLDHYYSDMSALGDTVFDDHAAAGPAAAESESVPGRIQNVSVPLCVIHALDDPLVTWRTVAANDGFLHPSNLSRTGSGNLVILLTKRGGHVGWPLGWFPPSYQWKWMNDAASSFINAVVQVKTAGHAK